MRPTPNPVIKRVPTRCATFGKACGLLLLLGLATASPAAARPSLTLERADRAAHRTAADVVVGYQDAYDETRPEWRDELTTIVRFDLDPCERTNATTAECPATYTMSDDDLCDDIITVKVTRRNKLITDIEDEWACDSGYVEP